jgi:cholesterol transport system auxiliary component
MIRRRVLLGAGALALAGCSSVAPDKPTRATAYDFGPLPAQPAAQAQAQPPIVLADFETTGALDSSALLYRLAYADANQLHPYSRARWSAPPSQLVRQRLRQVLGRDRAVLDSEESASLARSAGAMPRVLHVDLEEFAQVFDSPAQSSGVVRLRATLTDNTPGGERLVGQRVFARREPAPSADASGGVKAIAAAADAIAHDISAWLAQLR